MNHQNRNHTDTRIQNLKWMEIFVIVNHFTATFRTPDSPFFEYDEFRDAPAFPRLLLPRVLLRRLAKRDVDGREILGRLTSLSCGDDARERFGVLNWESDPRFIRYFGFLTK